MTSEAVLVPLEGLRRVLDDHDQNGIIDRLIKAGKLPKTDKDGRIDLLVTVPAFFTELRATLGENTASAAAERARAARAEAQELRLAEVRRELITHEDAEMVIDHQCGAILTALNGLPSRVTRDLPTRHRIEAIARAAQLAISNDLRDIRIAAE